MNRIDPDRMAEATLLTRAGRLSEATALIQELLGGGVRPAAAPQPWTGPTLDLRAEPVAEAPAATPSDLPGAWRELSYANPFGQRTYKLYVPAARTGMALPLVVMLHGCTQDPDDFARGTGMNRLAEECGCIVAYPGQSRAANPSKCWNWFQPSDQERERGEPSLIAGITREVIVREPVDAARVYVAGLSAGGAKAALMARAYPDLYAAVGVHSGLPAGAAEDLASGLAAMRQARPPQKRPSSGQMVPVIAFHGSQDQTVHPGNATALVDAALAAGQGLAAEAERGRVPGGHAYCVTRHRAAAGPVLVEDWRVEGLGHAWSGGDRAGSYTDPRGPDASRAMLEFFLRHRLARPSS